MDTQQIIDTIKTLNLNVNSESAVKITEEVMRYMYWKMFIDYGVLLGTIICITIISIAYFKKDKGQ